MCQDKCLLKKFKSYSFLCTLDAYLDLLELISPTSLVFEVESLMPYEVSLAVSRSVMQLNEKQDKIRTEDEFLDSFVTWFVIHENGFAKGEFPKVGDKRKKQPNREYISVEFDLDDFDRERCLQKVCQIKSNIIPVLVETLKTCFSNYDDAIYSKTRWLNPEMWCADKSTELKTSPQWHLILQDRWSYNPGKNYVDSKLSKDSVTSAWR